MSHLRIWAPIFLVLCLPALIFGQQPASQTAPIQTEKDITYGRSGDQDLQLNLAMPKSGDGPFPAIVCIHGGSWRAGKRQDLDKTIEVLAGRGYVAATVSYRLVPKAQFPAQIEDCKAAVRWLRANAAKYKINPERIGAVGFSAGAHLACLLGVTDSNDGLEGASGTPGPSSRVQAVVSFFGPTDFTDRNWSDQIETGLLVPFLGHSFDKKPEAYKKASPILYVTKDDPPFLFFHGTLDNLVGIHHSRRMCEKLKSVGVYAELVEVEGEGHGWRGDKLLKHIEQMVRFFDARLKP